MLISMTAPLVPAMFTRSCRVSGESWRSSQLLWNLTLEIYNVCREIDLNDMRAVVNDDSYFCDKKKCLFYIGYTESHVASIAQNYYHILNMMNYVNITAVHNDHLADEDTVQLVENIWKELFLLCALLRTSSEIFSIPSMLDVDQRCRDISYATYNIFTMSNNLRTKCKLFDHYSIED